MIDNINAIQRETDNVLHAGANAQAAQATTAPVQQSAGALLGITLAFSVVPGLFAALKAVSLWIYPLHQREVERIERELDERRALAAPGGGSNGVVAA